MPSDKLLSMHL